MSMNEQKLDDILLELGHDDFNAGTALLRKSVRAYEPGMSITKELYPGIARSVGSSAARVERNIRHSIEKAWQRCPHEVQIKYFGSSINPETGKPTNGEYIARLRRLTRDSL